MTDEHPVPWVNELLIASRQLGAEARGRRPASQPSGDKARLLAQHWFLSGCGGTELANLSELFSGTVCPRCLIPSGHRTDQPMKVRYLDGLSRQCDGVLAKTPECPDPVGPTYHLFTGRFLALLSNADQGGLRWRSVEILNATKTTSALYEIVHSEQHAELVALKGGSQSRFRCPTCHVRSEPYYPSVGSLPDWLNPWGDDTRRQQPDLYVSATSLRASPWYTFGDWRHGVRLATSDDRLWAGHKPGRRIRGLAGIGADRIGVVGPSLVTRVRKRTV